MSRQSQTLRVGTEQVDELVNLTGELIIAASAFDQQMNTFMDAVNELELARNRLREIARNMEVGYEVKALGSLKNLETKPLKDINAKENEDGAEFDALELDSYSELSMIIRTLNESAIDIGSIYTRYAGLHSEFDGHNNRQRVLLSELQDKMMKVRMLPMSTLSNKLRRTVREVSKMLGKKIRLILIGEDIELDRLVWEKITDPLMHLLRNSADHGIESPEIRKKKNKPLAATIKLDAFREGNQVVIRISDDGAGLNYKNIEKKARQAGFIAQGASVSEQELAALIFKPGLSTSDKISQVSGRGVGMDVVRENIHELKGTVKVASQQDTGTQFTIRIPLTFAAVRALLFTLSGQVLAIALNEIKEIIRVEPQNLITSPVRAIKTSEKILPLYSLKHFINSREKEGDASVNNYNPIVLVTGTGNDRKAIEIDSLIGQQEIVIKSTGSHLRYVKGISGVTIIGDGNVVPILNIPELIGKSSDHSAGTGTEIFDHGIMAEKSLSIMIVDDSVSIRQVVSRLIEDQGWKFRIAKDGIDALEKLQDGIPDLILLDVEMPRMNGYEFLSALGAEPSYKNIPVVMLTSRVTEKHREKALALGAREFVAKPYNDNEFIELILNVTS
ncbi:Two component system response regulator/histidine kinase, CheW domain-containing [Desulfonema limicola]|uniref:histidine kinase n=1 Tax=Desulfonema limicola TaxID=45656 RepID=A0A975GGJ5_9BACT|nr:hybrid sensor histidine kinase/response regulator [Desulfonema limicola]QTA80385.1 Two component system response regulator/histidine kinase, CheW domain-containing [Desulfonema limicola]